MAYQVGRSKKINEVLELLDNSGNVVVTVKTDIDVDKIGAQFNACYNKIISAERKLESISKSVDGGNLGELGKAEEAYGGAIISIFKLIFGEDESDKILVFFENNYIEMLTEIMPFISEIVLPRVRQSTEEKRKLLANNYKQKQRKLPWKNV